MDALKSELNLSQLSSIDAFLEHRRDEFLKAGKAAIALSLLSKENPDIFNDFENRDNGIYNFLYSNLTTSWEQIKENKLKIITFNYDRSLEHFLFSALKHSYNKSDIETAEATQSIPIIHVHGSLGPLPWQESGGVKYSQLFKTEQGPSEIAKRIRVASENIVIVSEAEPKSKEFETANKYLSEAERIYFLGFGYYPVNLERLGLAPLNRADISLNRISPNLQLIHCRGSAKNLGSSQIRSIQNQWNIWLPDQQLNALEFLREHADLD